MILSLAQFKAIARPPGGLLDSYKAQGIEIIHPDLEAMHDRIVHYTQLFEITDRDELCRWIAQCTWESGYFYLLDESLVHSPEWLTAHYWARKKTRWKLGNLKKWHAAFFPGRGLFHLTGLLNTLLFDRWLMDNNLLNWDVVEHPEQISEDLDLAVLAGIFYWDYHEVGQEPDFDRQTEIINGAHSGLEQRKALYGKALHVTLGG